MAIDLLNHKLDRAFDHIDAGGEGVVEREDLLGLGARILVGFGESPTSVTGSSLVDSFDGIWSALSGALGRRRATLGISREDFRTAMTAAFVEGDRYDAGVPARRPWPWPSCATATGRPDRAAASSGRCWPPSAPPTTTWTRPSTGSTGRAGAC